MPANRYFVHVMGQYDGPGCGLSWETHGVTVAAYSAEDAIVQGLMQSGARAEGRRVTRVEPDTPKARLAAARQGG